MTGLRLHAVQDWASLVVHLALAELDLPFEMVLHDPEAGTLDDPAFRALNPVGLLPVLETPDGPVFETGAILLWLSETQGRLAPAPGTPGRSRFLSWFVFVTNTLHPTVMALLHPYRAAGDAAVDAVGSRARDRLAGQLALLEAEAGRSPDWLRPDAPSILSLYVMVMVRWCAAFAADPAMNLPLTGYPTLLALVRAHEARPAIGHVAEVEGLGPTPFSDPQV